jgi:hypothetical protein
MNSAKWSCGSHSNGDGGSRNACRGAYGRNVLLTPLKRSYWPDPVDLFCPLVCRTEARTGDSFTATRS